MNKMILFKEIKNLITLFLFITFFYCQSQSTIFIKGKVTDSIKKPLPYASVIATPIDSTYNPKFSITDDNGFYNLDLIKDRTYKISVSYLGYQTINYTFSTSKNSFKNFIMKVSENKLEEVIIDLPVTVKGDTTTYNTKKFITGDERKLKNVLKKLPGIEVDKKGGITFQGRKINTMLVENEKFFGGGSKLAVENIPANVIDQIQIIDNYNEVSFLKNISDSDKLAMNIKLKEDKKRFAFGDIEAGKGNKDYYRAHGNLFYYSPKTNLNFIGNLNNVGEKTFTLSDYLSFSGALNAIFQGNFRLKKGVFAQFLESKDIVSSNQKFGALNITKNTSDKFSISAYAIFSHTKTNNFIETFNQYPTIIEDKTQNIKNKNFLGIGNLNIEYTPNSNSRTYFKTQVKSTKNQKNNQILSNRNENLIGINTTKTGSTVSIDQNIEWHKQKSIKHTFSSVVNYSFDRNNPKAIWSTNQPILRDLIPVMLMQNDYILNQRKETSQHNLHGEFKYFWILNRNNHIYTTIGNNFIKEKFITNDFQTLDNQTINNFSSDNYGNNINYSLNNLFGGIHYKFRKGIFTLKQGAFFHNYNWSINATSKKKWLILPDFLAKIKFSKSKKLQLTYNLKTNFSDASKLTNRFYLQSYNSIYKGNPSLDNELYHNASIYYNRLKLYKGLMFFARLNFTKKTKGFVTGFEPLGVNQSITTFLVNNPNEDWSYMTSISKRIKKIKYKFEINGNISNYLQKNKTILESNKSNNNTLEFKLETLFDNFPTISAGYKYSVGNYTQPKSTTKFETHEPYINIDYSFLKSFIFSFDYTFYDYQNKSQGLKNTYQLGNSVLSYKNENSPWSYKISAQNLFNTKFRQSNSFNDFLISDTKTYIMPRVIMFTIGYNL